MPEAPSTPAAASSRWSPPRPPGISPPGLAFRFSCAYFFFYIFPFPQGYVPYLHYLFRPIGNSGTPSSLGRSPCSAPRLHGRDINPGRAIDRGTAFACFACSCWPPQSRLPGPCSTAGASATRACCPGSACSCASTSSKPCSTTASVKPARPNAGARLAAAARALWLLVAHGPALDLRGRFPGFQIFAGLMETLAGLLLILPRTTALGALLGCADLVSSRPQPLFDVSVSNYTRSTCSY